MGSSNFGRDEGLLSTELGDDPQVGRRAESSLLNAELDSEGPAVRWGNGNFSFRGANDVLARRVQVAGVVREHGNVVHAGVGSHVEHSGMCL